MLHARWSSAFANCRSHDMEAGFCGCAQASDRTRSQSRSVRPRPARVSAAHPWKTCAALSLRPVIPWLSFPACVTHTTGLGVIHGKSAGDTCFTKERPSAGVCLRLLSCNREAPRTISVLKKLLNTSVTLLSGPARTSWRLATMSRSIEPIEKINIRTELLHTPGWRKNCRLCAC